MKTKTFRVSSPEAMRDNLRRVGFRARIGTVKTERDPNARALVIDDPPATLKGCRVGYGDSSLGPCVHIGEHTRYYPGINRAWARNGVTSIGAPKSIEEAIRAAERFERNDEFFCGGCREWHPREDLTLSHFAGNYCPPCAEAYKQKHRGVCQICGQPRWKCVC